MKRIAVLTPSGATSNWRKLEGVMEFARTCPDWEMQIVTSERIAEVRRALGRFRPDGIICALLDEKSMAYVATLGIPTVIAFHPGELTVRPERARYVVSDSVQIGRTVARHVYARGYRSFLCVGKRGSPWEKERFDAFEGELAKFNCRAERLAMPFTSAELLEALAALPRRTAVFAADDNVAVDVLNVARRHGLDVPRRFGVMGVSNLAIQCDNSHPPLTSLDQNFAHGGYLAAQRLKTLLRGGIVPKLSFYPPGEVPSSSATSASRSKCRMSSRPRAFRAEPLKTSFAASCRRRWRRRSGTRASTIWRHRSPRAAPRSQISASPAGGFTPLMPCDSSSAASARRWASGARRGCPSHAGRPSLLV